MNQIPENFRQLDQAALLVMTKDRPSVLLQQQAGLADVLEEISNRKCPTCAGSLVPRIPTDPTQVFSGSRTNYQSWCAACRTTAPFPPLAG